VSELSQLQAAIEDRQEEAWALATVVGVSGSTYRLPGAKQMLRADGTSIGTVSGGCLDADLVRIVGEVIASGTARFVSYDLSADDDEVWGFGLGCNGVTELLVEPAQTAAALLDSLGSAQQQGTSIAVVSGLSGSSIGSRLVVHADEVLGSFESDELTTRAVQAGRAALAEGRHANVTLGGEIRVFVEVQTPPPSLVVCGAGHDVIPLVRSGAGLGWRVTVVDDRSAYLTEERFPNAFALILSRPEELLEVVDIDARTDVVVMTHNYLRDVEYLRQLVGSRARYIGMLGPRARTDRILDDLRRQKVEVPEAILRRLWAPAGLDIGAEGPDQISWAIMAEILAVSRGRAGGQLRDRRKGIHQQPDDEEKP
jgi:xanthine/CO dehydrogenase XdhC/CoxF family maturation factor